MGILRTEDLPNYSYEDYLQWEGHWELIGGIPYAMTPSPVKKHQLLVGYIFNEAIAHLEECPDCEVLIDEDWKLNSSTVLRPDVSIVCGDKNPTHITKTPEIIFEVISTSTAKRDEELKFRTYEQEGVKYYILIYPDDLIAKIYRHNGKKFNKSAECDTNTYLFENAHCQPEIDFSNVFKRLRA